VKSVDSEVYFRFMKLLSPLRGGEHEGPQFVSSILELLAQPWFYGPFSRNSAEAVITMAKKEGKTNPFMVRISENAGFQYCLLYFDEKADKIEHKLITTDNYAKEGIIPYIQTQIKRHKYSHFVYNRPYEKIFQNTISLETETTTFSQLPEIVFKNY